MMSDIHYESADGLELYAKAYGAPDAPLTVLCLHGLTRNHKDFEPMIAALRACWRFIAVDVRGRGRSARASDPSTYSPAVYAEDMAALLDTLELDRVALIGTSMGGLMSMIMTKAAPERILGVVLNDVGPVVDPAGLDRIVSYVSAVEPLPDWRSAAEAVARIQNGVFPDYGLDDWMAFARRTFRETGDGQVVLDYDPEIARTVGEARPGLLTRFAMWRLYGAMKARPLLLVRGEASDILSERTAKKMIRRHPDAKLVTVPRVGHAPMLDEPEAASAISGFLARLEVDA